MRYLAILLTVFLLAGCASLYPNLKMPDQWKSLSGAGKAAAETVNAANQKEAISKATEADKKVEEARKKMELEYAKFREDLQKAYDDKTKKDNENFHIISLLNYGVYQITQEKKKIDINTTIAHLRSKEIMMRADVLTEVEKEKIREELDQEKTKTIDELYIKYKANIDLAIKQKAALDAAESLILLKEKEKDAIRTANKQNIQKLEADKAIELEAIRKAADDRVAIAREAQKAEMLGYIIKALVAVGVVFLILAGLLKSIVMGIVSISAFALAYTAAMVPMWVIMTVIGVMFAVVIWTNYASSVKKVCIKQPTIQ
jgi:hypothetical protein